MTRTHHGNQNPWMKAKNMTLHADDVQDIIASGSTRAPVWEQYPSSDSWTSRACGVVASIKCSHLISRSHLRIPTQATRAWLATTTPPSCSRWNSISIFLSTPAFLHSIDARCYDRFVAGVLDAVCTRTITANGLITKPLQFARTIAICN